MKNVHRLKSWCQVILATLLVVVSATPAFAQDKERRSLDELEPLLQEAEGEIALKLGLEIADNYKFEEPIRLRRLYNMAIERGRTVGDLYSEARLYHAIGSTHLFQENNADAERTLLRALERYRAIDDQQGITNVEFNLGVVARRNGDLVDAARRYREALRFGERADNRRIVGHAHNNLAFILGMLELHESALDHYLEAWRVAEEREDGDGAAVSALSVAGQYARLGDHDQAREFIGVAERHFAKKPTDFVRAYIHETKGVLAIASEEWKLAVSELEQAYELNKALGAKEALAENICGIFQAKLETDSSMVSELLVSECLERAAELKGNPLLAIDASVNAARFYAVEGRAVDAFGRLLASFNEFRSFSKSQKQQQMLISSGALQEELSRQAVLLAEQRAETAELRESRQRTRFLFTFICSALLLALLAVMAFFLREQRNSNNKLQVAAVGLEERQQQLSDALGQKELLLQELNHRVKNNLQVVASLLGLERRRAESEGLDFEGMRDVQARVLSMASIHEGLQDVGSFDTVDLVAYIERLADRFVPVYGAQFSVSVQSTGNPYIQLAAAAPVGLIVCELVSNAHEHAYPDGKDGKVTIGLNREGDCATLSVSDEGVGLPKEFDLSATERLGLSLVRDLASQIGTEISWKRNALAGVTWFLTIPEDVLDWEYKSAKENQID